MNAPITRDVTRDDCAALDAADVLAPLRDQFDLPPGVVRVKAGGGLAGNNGLRSITAHLHTQDYLRVRIGIGKPPSKERGASHVLSRLPAAERELLDVAIAVAADAVEEAGAVIAAAYLKPNASR